MYLERKCASRRPGRAVAHSAGAVALTAPLTRARVTAVPEPVEAFMDEYIRRYSERDLDGVTELCLAPFLAVREGRPIHMADRDAVRAHFAAMIDAYRGGGVAIWKRVESDVRELGEHAVFVTVRWNALDSDGNVLRDTRTTYHLLATADGWRFLSYTNHF
jgi:SnoaL-like domain